MSRRSEISKGFEVFVTRRMTWGKSSRDVERSRADHQLRTSSRVWELTVGRSIEEIPQLFNYRRMRTGYGFGNIESSE